MSAKDEGLKEKYWVSRVDRKPVGRCFVLDYENDPFAKSALLAYADACEKEYPKLAEDLRKIGNS